MLWRTPVAGGFAGPAVADGRGVRRRLRDRGQRQEGGLRRGPTSRARSGVLCLDAKTGKELWKHEYDCPYTVSYPVGPRCTPTVADGKVYSLGAEGNLTCLDAAKGTVLWAKDFKTDYGAKTPIWGFAGHPLVDGKMLYLRRRRRGQLRRRVRQGHRQGGLEGADRRGAGVLPADHDRGRRDEAAPRSGTPTSVNALDPDDRQEVLDRAAPGGELQDVDHDAAEGRRPALRRRRGGERRADQARRRQAGRRRELWRGKKTTVGLPDAA